MIKADMNSYMKKNLVDILISIATATRVYTPVDSSKIIIPRGEWATIGRMDNVLQ